MFGYNFMLFLLHDITLADAKWYHSQGWNVEIFPNHILFSKD